MKNAIRWHGPCQNLHLNDFFFSDIMYIIVSENNAGYLELVPGQFHKLEHTGSNPVPATFLNITFKHNICRAANL